MTFEQIVAILLKRWWIILLCFLTVGAGAYIGSKLITPLYQSTTLIQVAIRSGSNVADYNNLLASDQLVQTEAQLATSDPVLREVASHFRGLSVVQLEHEVSASPRVNTQLFGIDVLDASPKRAAALANEIAGVLIAQQKQGIEQENSQSQQLIQQDLDATERQIDGITTQITSLQATGQNPAKVSVLQARLSALQQRYSQWQGVLAQLILADAQNSDFLHVAQPAQPALSPAQPNKLLYVSAGLLVGLLLGILLVLLFEKLDTRVRTSKVLTDLLGWPVLATIWRTASKENVLNPTSDNPNVESYRLLRTNLGFSAIDNPLHSLIVTSALPQDGKSVISANLAIFMAKSGKKTLLIDADLRNSTQHQQFDLSPDKIGLSNAVLAISKLDVMHASAFPELYEPGASKSLSQIAVDEYSLNLDSFIHSIDIPNLWIMPSGPMPPNPPELLDSKAMQSLFTLIMKSNFDVVIFDSPPVLGLSDVSILASKVDGAIVIVDVTHAHKERLLQMKSLLAQAGIRVIGCVVNKQRRNRGDTTYYSYYRRSDKQNGKMRRKSVDSLSETPAIPVNISNPASAGTSDSRESDPLKGESVHD